ncbi:12767_t:CDS:2 [Cetraspora pellucida]|uniref:12767_t:CDS:1 n=1 Tax=Cetraspora pellucida TaxID=1433469 RepID=A0A9N8Z4Z5_9GLOM|nr:12767_t:CDS:2 [Cetraspora pellucida]
MHVVNIKCHEPSKVTELQHSGSIDLCWAAHTKICRMPSWRRRPGSRLAVVKGGRVATTSAGDVDYDF